MRVFFSFFFLLWHEMNTLIGVKLLKCDFLQLFTIFTYEKLCLQFQNVGGYPDVVAKTKI